MSLSAQQRGHYSMMAEQEAARRRAIRALVALCVFPDDSNAAIRSLRLLEASPSEMSEAAASEGRDTWLGELAAEGAPGRTDR